LKEHGNRNGENKDIVCRQEHVGRGAGRWVGTHGGAGATHL